MVGFAVWENAGIASAAKTAAKNTCFANFIEISLRLFCLLAAFIHELLRIFKTPHEKECCCPEKILAWGAQDG
jgi:hypothetical protein